MLNCGYFFTQVFFSQEQLQPHSHIQVTNMNTIDTNNKKEFRTKENVGSEALKTIALKDKDCL